MSDAAAPGADAPPPGYDVSATVPDWSREAPRGRMDVSRRFLAALRDVERYRTKRTPLRRRIAVLRYRFWTILAQADIAPGTAIGGGLLMPHPNGIVINPESTIGPNCLIMQQVTIGIARPGERAPRIGGHVDLSAGAKIIGDIEIGNHALIGANAVVTKDVPAYAIMVGIPAKQIGTRTAAD
jgi:serine O-acetyltransferase